MSGSGEPRTGPSRRAAHGPNVRDHLIDRFAAWLDRVLEEEQPPSGLAAEILEEVEGSVDLDRIASPDRRTDFQALWAALTAACQEIRLQGRSFKELSEKAEPLRDLGPRVEALLRSHEGLLEAFGRLGEEARRARDASARAVLEEGERRGQRELLDVILDLRERLARGLRTTATPEAPSPRGRILGRLLRRAPRPRAGEPEAIAAVRKGYSMTLDRLEEALARLGVEEIPCRDLPFDPHRMAAIEVTRTDSVPEGTVLDVVRPGYVWNGELLRTARVRVAASGSQDMKVGDPQEEAR